MIRIRYGRHVAEFYDLTRTWRAGDPDLVALLTLVSGAVQNSPAIPRLDLAVADAVPKALPSAEVIWVSWSPPDPTVRIY